MSPIIIDEMMCNVVRIAYDYETRCGFAWFADGDCCDMSGCIQFFSRLDPAVAEIQTYSGKAIDTAYQRAGHGQWRALVPAPNIQRVERHTRRHCSAPPIMTGLSELPVVPRPST
jgi:hypothetical protein